MCLDGKSLFSDDQDGGKRLQSDPGNPVTYRTSVEYFPSPRHRDAAVNKTDNSQCSPGVYRLAEGGIP